MGDRLAGSVENRQILTRADGNDLGGRDIFGLKDIVLDFFVGQSYISGDFIITHFFNVLESSV
jgi:hypothetical protein